MKIARIDNTARFPTKGSLEAAGFDLYMAGDNDFTLYPMQRQLFPTRLIVAVPDGYYGRVAPRHGIDVLAGVVDSDYRGELMVMLINLGEKEITFHPGNRIAQLVVEKYASWRDISIVAATVGELADTERGAGGFGSTGK
mgnify:CR=1 FL=1